jgi:hypothetical protein
MAKDEQTNQLNLTVVALVALVAIVGLVALVMNAASIGKVATGSQIASALPEGNLAGNAMSSAECMDIMVYKGKMSAEKAAAACVLLE